MTTHPAATGLPEPESAIANAAPSVLLEIAGRRRQLDPYLFVSRVLPSAPRKMIGPFIFFDHMGPTTLAPASGIDVRPHPHIHLATVTYLFEGELEHRDSLGTRQTIVPGDLNIMSAGRGIAHSERSLPAARATGPKLHGLQLWVALPKSAEEGPPTFTHYPGASLPQLNEPGLRVRVLCGEAFGMRSPAETSSRLFYVDAHLAAGARLELPRGYRERALYVVTGEMQCEGSRIGQGHMVLFRHGANPVLESDGDAHVVLLGGDPLDGPRYIWWNFVSSSTDRIVQAAEDWRHARFATIPGDDVEFIPAPETPHLVDDPFSRRP